MILETRDKMKGKKIKIVVFVLLVGVLLNVLWLGFTEKMPAIGLSDEQLLREKMQRDLDEGKDIALNGNEVNALFKDYFRERSDFGVFKIKGIAFKLQEETLSIYVSLHYKSIPLVLSSRGQVGTEDQFIGFKLNKVYLGKLPIPKKLLLSRVDRLKNKNLKVQEETVYMSKALLPLENVKSLKIQNSKLLIKSSRMLQEDENGNQQEGTKELDKETLQSFEKVIKDLDKVENSLKGKDQKQFIQETQKSLNLIVKDPGYPYEEDIDKTKKLYEDLSPKEQNQIKWKLFSHVNMEDLLLLKDFFGL